MLRHEGPKLVCGWQFSPGNGSRLRRAAIVGEYPKPNRIAFLMSTAEEPVAACKHLN
jgi:hypothetical protein